MIDMLDAHGTPRRNSGGSITRSIHPALPSQVTFFVNWACNLRCRHCWLYGDRGTENAWLKGAAAQQMTVELFGRVISELEPTLPDAEVCLMGGEPYLHPDLSRMVERAKSGGAYVYTYTNGTLLEKRGDAVLASGIDAVSVSLDGSCAAIHDAIRGMGAFDRTLRGIEHSLRRRPRETKIGLNFSVTGLNYRDIPKVAELAQRLGVDELALNFPMFLYPDEGMSAAEVFAAITRQPFESWRGFVLDRIMRDIDTTRFEAILEELLGMTRTFRVVVPGLGYSNDERATYFDHRWKQIVKERRCPRLTLETTVLPNGDVLSCSVFRDTVLGNVRDRSLAEIWADPAYDRLRLRLDQSLLDVCYRCTDLLDPEVYEATSRG